MADHEAELESFRRKWREEVQKRNNTVAGSSRKSGNTPSTPGTAATSSTSRKAAPPLAASAGTFQSQQEEEHTAQTFHDLEDKSDALKLKNQEARSKAQDRNWQPNSALEHYEKAVETEVQGKLGDSVGLYRKAFKLDSGVHEAYKQKHFPPSSFVNSKPQQVNPSNASPTVPNPAHHSLHGSEGDTGKPVISVSSMIDSFASLAIPGAEPETSISRPPPCPISGIPDEILTELILSVALSDVASLSRLSTVCKRLAYLVDTEDRIWKRICLNPKFGFVGMHYLYSCDLYGNKLLNFPLLGVENPIQPPSDPVPERYATYRGQFRYRPRIRFGGCYISTVNYTRPGAASQDQRTWYNPVHIVTYYRYLRFFRDGRVLSLLTTAEPQDVVHHITWENLHGHYGQGLLPSAVMKDALQGRWRLSGACQEAQRDVSSAQVDSLPPDLGAIASDEPQGPGFYHFEPNASLPETEGDVLVETEGVVPKYMWKLHFSLANSGRKDGTRNNKLNWKGFWSYDRLADDWGEFEMKSYRPFYWSRVKSYGLGLE